MSEIIVGLGWDTRADIDASVIMCLKSGAFKDSVYYGQLTSNDNAVVHQGDNLTGEGDGDDEQIHINLAQVKDTIHSIWPVVNVYTAGMSFNDVSGAYCRLLDKASG